MESYDDFEMALNDLIDEPNEENDNIEVKSENKDINIIKDPLGNIQSSEDTVPSCKGKPCSKRDMQYNLLLKKMDQINKNLTIHYFVESILIFIIIVYMIMDFLL